MKDWGIVGHTWAVQQMQQAIVTNEVPHALLFTGPESVGKMTLARMIAAALLCQAPQLERPCGICLACRKLTSGNHPDVMVVEPEGTYLKIDQIRAVERFLALTPNESACKIALISGFGQATIGAANALLKTLEEPPSYAHLILLAQEMELLLPTIISRSQPIHLRPLPANIVEQALIERWQISPDEAERLARISGGRIGWAVRAATEPSYYQRMEASVTMLLDILQQDLPARFDTAQTLAKDAKQLGEQLEYWLTGWRDVLLLQTKNDARIVYREYQDTLSRIAQQTSVSTTTEMIHTLEKSQLALLRNANTQLLMENLLLVLPTL
jgi:DNA polymerase-3 subunit delta'